LKHSPYILYSNGNGNIFEDTTLYATGRSGWNALPIPDDEWIELPVGGQLYELPERRGIGIDVETGEMRLCEKGWAVAAFIPPAHTGLYIAAYESLPGAETLPLFCYTAAGWQNDKFYVPAIRIEKDVRQESEGFINEKIKEGVANYLTAYPHNRLVKHLADTADPLAGSYFVENLTDEVEREAWKIIEKIDVLGGSVTAIEQGYIQNEIAKSAYEYQKKIESAEKIIVGVNKFKNEQNVLPPSFRINDNIRQLQIDKLKTLKQKRNNNTALACLQLIKEKASGTGNLMPAVLDAVENHCTLGEIANTLRDVFGEHK
jgi:hypothetical protein